MAHYWSHGIADNRMPAVPPPTSTSGSLSAEDVWEVMVQDNRPQQFMINSSSTIAADEIPTSGLTVAQAEHPPEPQPSNPVRPDPDQEHPLHTVRLSAFVEWRLEVVLPESHT